MMNPTLAEALRKEQELHERYCETVRTVILIGRKVGLHPSTVSEHLNGRRRR